MKNYICINGKKTELPKEFLEEVMQSRRGKATIDGDIVALFDGKEKYEFIVLDRSKDTVALLLKDLLVEETAFGSNNDYRGNAVLRGGDPSGSALGSRHRDLRLRSG